MNDPTQTTTALLWDSLGSALAASSLDQPLAFGAMGTRTRGDFHRDTAHLVSRLLAADAARCLVYTADAYAAAVAVTALAATGKIGVLAPNAEPGTLAELGTRADAVLFDQAGTEKVFGRQANPALDARLASLARIELLAKTDSPTPSDLPAPDPDRVLVEMFTSGTGGTPTCITKRLRHLESEVAILEQTFGGRFERGSRIFSTVSPQHLYGLLFRVLWPLLAGRAFQRETLLRPEELIPQLTNDAAAILIGTPTHLRILATGGSSPSHSGCVRAVFSSGGPLPLATSQAVEATFGSPPIEIFGSTETGGIAHRVQTPNTLAPWKTFESVSVAIDADDGLLTVTSPFVSMEGGYTGGDRARWMDEGGFELLGRADRVVQVAEKRVALPELEARLLPHAFVDEVAAGPFEHQATTRIGVLVVLTEEGRQALSEHGRAHVGAALGELLAPFYDRVVLPRRWRYVETLPTDQRGKLTMRAISALLTTALAEGPETRPMTPTKDATLVEDFSHDQIVERHMSVPENLAYLDGHFPGFPLVPGVVQVKWVMAAAEELLSGTTQRATMKTLKFNDPLRPGDSFLMRVEWNPEASKIHFALTDGPRRISSGTLVLTENTTLPTSA